MRAKQLLSKISIPSQVKLVYARLTLNRLTTFYFIVSVTHFVLQVFLQLAAHTINVDARRLITGILDQAKLTMDKFALVETKRISRTRETDLTLTLCRGIPGQFGLTGKDVCDVLWSQSRGLVNETLEDFLSPSSGSDHNHGSISDSGDEIMNQRTSTDDEETKTKTDDGHRTTSSSTIASSWTRSSSSLGTVTPSTLPFAIALPTSSSTLVVSTSSIQPTLTSASISSQRTSTINPPTAASSLSTSSRSNGLIVPTDAANGIRPGSDSDSDDDGGRRRLLSARLFQRRRVLKQTRTTKITQRSEGEKKVFDREKIRPLSLPPRPRSDTPLSLPAEVSVDIDESRPDLEAHTRLARVVPITNSLFSRAREGLEVEFVPIAPRAIADPKRFVSSRSERPPVPERSKRSKRNLSPRALTEQDLQSVTITPVFASELKHDGEKEMVEANSGTLGMNSTATLGSVQGKPRLVAVKVSGLLAQGSGDAQLLAEGGASNNTATLGDVTLSPGCALALSWPAQVLRDFALEDLAMIGFQAWLLGMNLVAILNESVPHLVAGLFTQALSTGWSAFQMARSASFRARYDTIIVRGACSGVDVLPGYFSDRTKDEIPIVVFNGVFLVTMLVLSWKMCKVYGWQTFKRIGASRVMSRVYRLVLAFSIHLQLAVYFFVTSTALWVDELINGPVACFAEHAAIYKGIFITSILLLLPWLVLGWIGVRRENKHMMHAFLVISLLFITAWAAMFASDVYRWTFVTWPFFAVMTVTSFVVLVGTTSFAIVCRFNFKRGLALFLQSQQILPEANFMNAMPDPEKVVFPTQQPGEELLTFSVAFGHGGNPQPPSQMFPARPAPISRTSTLTSERTVEYSANPYATSGSDSRGDNSTMIRSEPSADTSDWGLVREGAAVAPDVPQYSLEDANPPQQAVRRELPQWQEVRRSQLSHWESLNFQPQTQIQPQIQPDRSSVYSTGTISTGQVEVLRDGRWQKIDARELRRASGVPGMTHASRFSSESSLGDDAGRLASQAPVTPAPTYRPQLPSLPATRGFVGLPGKNIRPPAAGALGGVPVLPGW